MMASSTDAKFHKESTLETSFDCPAIPRSSTRYENPAFMESCPAVLEPSRLKPGPEDETSRYLLDIFASHPPSASTFVPALVGSASIHSLHHGGELMRSQEKKAPTCCSSIVNCYSSTAITFRNSKFFYIIQLLVCLIPLSTIAMGIKYSKHCSSTFPVLSLIIAIFGVMFVGVWISINVFHHLGRHCTGQQKFLVRLLFVFLAILLAIEMCLYFNTSESFNPTVKNYCNKTFIDFTYYKYIALGGSLVLATILYIPDFRSFMCTFECSMPILKVSYDEI